MCVRERERVCVCINAWDTTGGMPFRSVSIEVFNDI